MRRIFRLNKANGKLMGVCAGIADYLGVDATFVRVAAIVATLAFPWTLLVYGAAALLARPAPATGSSWDRALPRASRSEVGAAMRDIDRRMAEVEHYVTNSSSQLAREIEELR